MVTTTAYTTVARMCSRDRAGRGRCAYNRGKTTQRCMSPKVPPIQQASFVRRLPQSSGYINLRSNAELDRETRPLVPGLGSRRPPTIPLCSQSVMRSMDFSTADEIQVAFRNRTLKSYGEPRG